MKVAIITRFPDDPAAPHGGVESVSVNLVAALAKFQDLEMHVVTTDPKCPAASESVWNGVPVHRLAWNGWRMLTYVTGEGRRQMQQYLAELAPDVIHAHDVYGLMVKGMHVPRVFTVHGFIYADTLLSSRAPRLRSWLWKRAETAGWADQPHIISISPYVREWLAGFTRATIYDIDNPVDPAFFAVEHHEIPGRVFSAGWVTHLKNTLGLVMAFARVVRSGVDASLHVAGEQSEPAYAEKVKETIGELGLTDRIVLLGRIGPDAIRKELGEASVFALPSRQENAPMAIAEAMAVGVPVISSNRCGMPYMVQEGETGFLADPEDCGTLGARIRQILTDKPLRAKMAAAARRVAESRFHSDSVARKTVEVYREIVSRSA